MALTVCSYHFVKFHTAKQAASWNTFELDRKRLSQEVNNFLTHNIQCTTWHKAN